MTVAEIMDEIADVVKFVLHERVRQHFAEQAVDVPGRQIMEKTIEGVKVICPEHVLQRTAEPALSLSTPNLAAIVMILLVGFPRHLGVVAPADVSTAVMKSCGFAPAAKVQAPGNGAPLQATTNQKPTVNRPPRCWGVESLSRRR